MHPHRPASRTRHRDNALVGNSICVFSHRVALYNLKREHAIQLKFSCNTVVINLSFREKKTKNERSITQAVFTSVAGPPEDVKSKRHHMRKKTV